MSEDDFKSMLMIFVALATVALMAYAMMVMSNSASRDSCLARWRYSGYEARFDDAGCRVRVGDKWLPQDAVKVK